MNVCINTTEGLTATLNTGTTGYDATWEVVSGSATIANESETATTYTADVTFTGTGTVTIRINVEAETGGCLLSQQTETFTVVDCICSDANGTPFADGTVCNDGFAGTCCAGNCVQIPTITIT
jgi:uncharacterized protein with beta-barrel porin domain